ncbi:MAG: hypothetical protein QM750_23145 [Rubrivivax sp.]
MAGLKLTGAKAMQDALKRAAQQPDRLIASAVVDTEDYVEKQIAKHHRPAPQGTGALRASLYKRRLPDGWEIGHDQQVAPHAKYVHWGTPPHEIRPKNKRALRYARDGIFWFWFGPKEKAERASIMRWVRKYSGDNARVMFRWPHHPGYAGDQWLVRANDFCADRLRALFKGL